MLGSHWEAPVGRWFSALASKTTRDNVPTMTVDFNALSTQAMTTGDMADKTVLSTALSRCRNGISLREARASINRTFA